MNKELEAVQWIGFDCWFWDEVEHLRTIARLKEVIYAVESGWRYVTTGGISYSHCRPVVGEDLKIWNNRVYMDEIVFKHQ